MYLFVEAAVHLISYIITTTSVLLIIIVYI